MTKRRDKKGRVLREGEYQLSDGRYRFRYIDCFGEERCVHSSRLDMYDPFPPGKKRGPALRELEKQIQADLFDKVASNGGGLTVLQLVEKYIKTKTDSGTRVLPMTPEVEACFRKIIENRPTPMTEPVIEGRMGFLYLDKNGNPMYSLHWEKYFKFAIDKHNKIYKYQLPKIPPHICRHTYCTNMAMAGTPPKILQYLMGHSEIGVTMNTYTHVGLEDAKAIVSRLKIG